MRGLRVKGKERGRKKMSGGKVGKGERRVAIGGEQGGKERKLRRKSSLEGSKQQRGLFHARCSDLPRQIQGEALLILFRVFWWWWQWISVFVLLLVLVVAFLGGGVIYIYLFVKCYGSGYNYFTAI